MLGIRFKIWNLYFVRCFVCMQNFVSHSKRLWEQGAGESIWKQWGEGNNWMLKLDDLGFHYLFFSTNITSSSHREEWGRRDCSELETGATCREFGMKTRNNKWGITSIYQPTNAHIISHKTLLKHIKTLRHVSILSEHHQGA